MTKKLLIRNGNAVCPQAKLDNEKVDIAVVNGKIDDISQNISGDFEKTIDASGCIIMPGFVDMHVHFREPGFEVKETILTGSNAAAAGGFTAVATMPNTDPPVDNNSVVSFIKNKAANVPIKIYPVGSISKKMKGIELSEIGLMYNEGIVALSEDGKSVMDSGLMKCAMRYSLMYDIPIICHCEDINLAKNKTVNEGKVSCSLGLEGIPKAAEEIIVSRDIILAKDTGARIHIAHVSTKGSLELIKRAKDQGVKITCETAPHYLYFTDEETRRFDTDFKMNPPLREKEDVEALIKGIKDGTIDAIATDHAPHTIDEKDVEFDLAPNGVIGLETSVSAVLNKLYHKEKISLLRIAEIMSLNPSTVLGIDKISLKQGNRADLTILNTEKKWVVDPSNFKSKARNTPFKKMTLKGKVKATVCEGKVVYEES